MAQTAAQTPVPTLAQLSAMPYAQQQAALAAMPADQQAATMAQLGAMKRAKNAQYMARSIRKFAICPPSSGSGMTQNYSAGSSLIYNFPTAGGAFISRLIFKLSLTVNAAVGTGAAYAVNAGRAWALIDRIRVNFNGTQHQFRPLIIPYLEQMRGYERSRPGLIISGQSATSIQNGIEQNNLQAGAVLPTGNTVITLWFEVPLNALHDLDPMGLMPAMGAGTQGQIEVICAPSALGPDPILNYAVATAGTGTAITVTGTVEVDAEYVDGTNFQETNPLALDLRGLPTVQYVTDEVLSPLTAGTINRHKIATLLQHNAVLSLVVDGQQSSKFATRGNIAALELAQDSVGQNKFFAVGVGSGNISVDNFFNKLRARLGQDLDEGVIPWSVSTIQGVVNPSNREGVQLLNMTANGWTDVHHGYQLTAVGAVAGITPRVETFLISINPAGLGIQ